MKSDDGRLSDAAFGGLGRSVRLARAFRLEQTDPDFFYSTQAADTVEQVSRYMSTEGRLVLDVGGGGGYFTKAFNEAGARAVLIEPMAGSRALSPDPEDEVQAHHAEAIRPGRLAPGCTVAGSGYDIPVASGVADLAFSSNVWEHVADVDLTMDELVRVTRPGGLIYISFTTWFSLWGGHQTAPWHFLGGEWAARRYERLNGHPPGNRFGETLFARHAGRTIRELQARPDVVIVDALPRYWPDWLHWLVKVPVIREFAVWNLLVILRRVR